MKNLTSLRGQPAACLALPAMLALALGMASCTKKPAPASAAPAAADGQLLRVGSIVVTQADLEQQLKDQHSGSKDAAVRKQALEQLVSLAQLAQAALDEGLDRDPLVRAEIARVLGSRLKEKVLFPRISDLKAPVAEARLRELYTAGEARFRSNEKRQAAVLWLNPSGDPQRQRQYQEKLTAARDWFSKDNSIKDHPELGFSVLGADYSEHQASRYKGGVIGWLERDGHQDPWTKAVAEMAYSLKEPGEVSEVITRPEGVFLIRYMAQAPAVLRPFESVRGELEQLEHSRLRDALEASFKNSLEAKHPPQWLAGSKP